MNRDTIKWGIGGAVGAIAFEFALVLMQQLQPYGSPFRESVHHVVVATIAPVGWVLNSLGAGGEESPGVIVLLFGSIFLYLAGMGFAVAAGLRKLWRLI